MSPIVTYPLESSRSRVPGGQDMYGNQCPVPYHSSLLGCDLLTPHWPNIDQSGYCRSQSQDLECSMSSQSWVTQVTRKLHWGGGSSPDHCLAR